MRGEVSGSRMQAHETVDVCMGRRSRSCVGSGWVGVAVKVEGSLGGGGGGGGADGVLGVLFLVMRSRVVVVVGIVMDILELDSIVRFARRGTGVVVGQSRDRCGCDGWDEQGDSSWISWCLYTRSFSHSLLFPMH